MKKILAVLAASALLAPNLTFAQSQTGDAEKVEGVAAARCAHGDAEVLTAEHEAVGAGAIRCRQDVDGHAVYGHILGSRKAVGDGAHGGQPNQLGGYQREDEETDDDAQLSCNDPGSAVAHGQVSEPVHHGGSQQFQRPGQGDHADEPRHVAGLVPLGSHPGRNRDVEQTKRQTLSRIEYRQRDKSPRAAFDERNQAGSLLMTDFPAGASLARIISGEPVAWSDRVKL